MATDLAEILTDLTAHATTSPRDDSAAAADARVALSRLRPALDRLHDDGLDTGISTSADPDAFTRQAERVHWVRLLANTCARLGHATPAPETPGPMTRLADAAAVTAVLHADVLTGGQRWAIVAGLARTANHLVTAAGGGDRHSPDIDRALIIAEASSGVLFQFAALDPPAAADYAALRRPVPDPTARAISLDEAALEASAALVHATRPGTGPHPIADILAIATAATTVCRFVAATHPGDDGVAALARDAARAWVDVREQLTPFNDGSRRPQPLRPPAVESALALHRAFQTPTPVPALALGLAGIAPAEHVGAGIGVVVDRLSAVAGRLDVAVIGGVASGRFMAYAVDLPIIREAHVGPFLERRRAAGLVTVDADDIAPVGSALHRVQVSTAALGTALPGPSTRSSTRPATDYAAPQDVPDRYATSLPARADPRGRRPADVATPAHRSHLLSPGRVPGR